MEEKEKDLNLYLKEFEKEFNVHIQENKKKTPLLLMLFSKFAEEIYTRSKIYETARITKAKIETELLKGFNKKQKKLWEEWGDCESKISGICTEQAFIFGYSMACQLKEEATTQYPYKEKEQ